MSNLIYRIIFCIGAVVSILYVFIPAEEGIFESASMAISVIINDPSSFLGLEYAGFFDIFPMLLSVLIYWIPTALLLASVVLIFALPKKKISIIFTAISSVLFAAVDIICLINDTVFIGIFVNLIGIILAGAGIALFFIGDEDKFESETDEDEPYGVITCLSGEYTGGKFHVTDKLVIGHDPSECNVVLSSKTISRIHCIIKYIPQTDTYTVRDVSKNGTFGADDKRFAKNFEMQVPRMTEIYMGENKDRFLLD